MPHHENIVILEFEIETDKDHIMEFLADASYSGDLNGKVTRFEGTTVTTYDNKQ